MNTSQQTIHSIPMPTLDALLAQLVRYRLTVFDAIRSLPEFSGMRKRQVHKLLHHFQSTGWIDSEPLYQGTRYWRLTAEGARHCNLVEGRSGPLSEAAKLRAYAMLHFCLLSTRLRHRLTSEELRQQFPMLYRPGLPGSYFFDPTEIGQIGLLRVDASGRGRWDRVVQSLRHDIAGHVLQPGFRRLVDTRRFQVTLITILPQKASRIREALGRFRDAKRVPVEVVSMPELLPLVGPSRRKEGSHHRFF